LIKQTVSTFSLCFSNSQSQQKQTFSLFLTKYELQKGPGHRKATAQTPSPLSTRGKTLLSFLNYQIMISKFAMFE